MGDKLIVRCSNRNEWRAWLSENYKSCTEAWFVFPCKDSGEEGVSYNDAVEEALCFGWIDGQAGTLDETHQLRRFTPRRKGSTFSRPNIERLIRLDRHDMLIPEVKEAVSDVISRPFVYPRDIISAIRKDKTAWANYQSFAEPYRRIRVAYIDAARKRPEEFARRLANFILKTRENKIITGYGGVEKYYRPELTTRLSGDEFAKWYWLKEELEDFCRDNGIPASGGKVALAERIREYLDSGVVKVRTAARKKPSGTPAVITLDSVIEENFVCSEKHRAFFREQIGSSFSFNVKFQKWLKSNPGKTYRDAVDAYHEIKKAGKNTRKEIDRQFEYNTYVRDFFEHNKGLSLDDAIRCWKYKKSLPGSNRYEDSDLEVLNG